MAEMVLDADKVLPSPTGTANSRAYLALKRAVFSGRFPPGEVITLRAVAAMLDLGEMPAREAIKRLISEGGLEGLPNRSARVPVLTRHEIEQIFDLRMILEAKAAALAAANITLHQIEGLRAMHDGMVAAVASRDFEEYKRLNMAFHFEIYRIANNRPLSSLIESLWLRMAPFISRTIDWVTAVPGRFEQIANCRHDELLTALQNRDGEAAHVAMEIDLAEIHQTDGYWEAMVKAGY